MIEVGISVVDITPPAGSIMAGYAARTNFALGKNDPLTVRAIVVGKTALVTADVIGIDATMSKRVRRQCNLPDQAITIAATHTHSGPPSMPGRLFSPIDIKFITKLEKALINAINTANSSKIPVKMFGGVGEEPGIAKNRRYEGGPVDEGIPILRFEDMNGKTIALMVSYACHPVVLGPDNLLWSADYIHYCRKELEGFFPGAIAIFATGCAGDVNTGHSAKSSLSKSPQPQRTFAAAQQVGLRIANSVYSAEMHLLETTYGSAETFTKLEFSVLESSSSLELSRRWGQKAKIDPENEAILNIWSNWAENIMDTNMYPINLRSTALYWGGAMIISLPGEIFAETALRMRQKISSVGPLFLLSYADDNPGYIPPQSEYNKGGYEVEEAHRFYGLGATFAPGSAERLESAGRVVWESAILNLSTNSHT